MSMDKPKDESARLSEDSTKNSSSKTLKKNRLSLKKRLIYMFVLYGVIFFGFETGLRVWRNHHHQEQKSVDGPENNCETLVFLCIGDSMTYGLGAPPENSYPMRLNRHFKKFYPQAPFKIYNLGIPGTNTSEGMRVFKFYLQSKKHIHADFALIMYGVNNRWNLHQATIWGWDETMKSQHALSYWTSHLQISKLVSIISSNQREMMHKLSKAPGNRYRKMLDEHGWSMFFDSFKDELLAKWIKYDLKEMAKELQAKDIRPILLTYHYERFDHLNDLIRQAAREDDIPLFELERDYKFYNQRRMFDKDHFHLNDKGYNFLARQVAKSFSQLVDKDSVSKILLSKRGLTNCTETAK